MRYVLVVLGFVLMIVGFTYDASVPSGDGIGSIMNLGLIAQKQLIFSFGAVLFLAGVVLVGTKGIEEAVRPSAEPKVPTEADRSSATEARLAGWPGHGPKPEKQSPADGQY